MTDKLRNARVGRTGRIFLVVAAVFVLWRLIGPQVAGGEASVFTTGEALDAAGAGPVDESSLFCIDQVELRAGQAPALALQEAGCDPVRAMAMLEALGELVDLRAIQPRDAIRLFRTRAGEVERLEYERHTERYYAVNASGDGYEAVRHDRPVATVIRHLEGDVRDNLFDSVRRAGGSPGLVVELSDLFAWSFDFFTDTRNGDRFELLVEERRIDYQRTGYGRILGARYHPMGEDAPLEVFFFAQAEQGEGGYYDAEGRSIQRMFLKSPLNYRRISSHYTHRRLHPITKKIRPHLGVDYAAASGTPVVSLGRGKIEFAGWIRGFGNTVKVRHNGTYLTQYAHLSGFAKGMRKGTRVAQGQTIGFVGSTGHSTGPHLDFRVRENGKWINPLHLKGGRNEPLPASLRTPFLAQAAQWSALMDHLESGATLAADPGTESPGTESAGVVGLDTPQGS